MVGNRKTEQVRRLPGAHQPSEPFERCGGEGWPIMGWRHLRERVLERGSTIVVVWSHDREPAVEHSTLRTVFGRFADGVPDGRQEGGRQGIGARNETLHLEERAEV